MINLLTLFYSFSGLVPGTGPRSQLNKLGDKDLCCVGVETLNHFQCTVHVCNPQNVTNINHKVSLEAAQHNAMLEIVTGEEILDLNTFPRRVWILCELNFSDVNSFS